ncbi:MAG: polyphenol oxidase family protein [Thermoanaerobaculia bacterium]|nr:polyphenol oxidase family protein [Thermoanaerobaculia bacterium]
MNGPARLWRERLGGARLLFVGRSPEASGRDALAAAGVELPLAWARQIHSAQVLSAPADGGEAGRGDALVTTRRELALGIAVADCVPVALAGEGELALAHAGWRGIVAGVVPAAAGRMASPPTALTAWIGPAIGACCYEVDRGVAAEVAGVGGPEVVVAGPREKPHLDLRRAVAAQLARLGVERINQVDVCTRCRSDLLWSYRRDGAAAGRNFLFGWMARRAAPQARRRGAGRLAGS